MGHFRAHAYNNNYTDMGALISLEELVSFTIIVLHTRLQVRTCKRVCRTQTSAPNSTRNYAASHAVIGLSCTTLFYKNDLLIVPHCLRVRVWKCIVFKEIIVVYTVHQIVLVQVSGWRKDGDGGGRSKYLV